MKTNDLALSFHDFVKFTQNEDFLKIEKVSPRKIPIFGTWTIT